MKRDKFLLFFLIISVCLNIITYTNSALNKKTTHSLEKDIVELKYDLNNMINIMPGLKPSIDKNELFNLLNDQFPKDKVELLADHVRWRFFNFWYSGNILKGVTYGS